MTIHNPSMNCVLVAMSNGTQLLFSYSTCVAGFIPGIGYFCADVKYSRTSNMHMGRYFSQAGAKDVTPLPQEDIDRIVRGL